MPAAPATNTTSTTFQIGTYNALTDTFTLVLDLNDSTWFRIRANGLDLGTMPPKIQNRANNIRVPGEIISAEQWKNRHIKAQVWLRPGGTSPSGGSSAVTTALLGRLRLLEGIVNNPPFVLRIALPGSTAYSYADVRATTHTITAATQEILAGAISKIDLDFECAPFFRGDRLTLQNLVTNPGFEAPSGPGVQVFADTFANANAYNVQTGSALISDFGGLPSTVLPDAPARYMRFNEASGTTAVDGSRFGQHGTISGTVTYGTPGLLTGDTDTAFTFDGSSGYVSVVTSGLASGAAAWSLACLIKLSATPGGNIIPLWYGTNVASQGAFFQISSTLTPSIVVFGGSNAAGTTGSVTLNTPHLLVMTYDGTTLRGYLDGSTTPFGSVTVTLNIALAHVSVGAGFFSGSVANFVAGVLDEALVFTSALSGSRVAAYYTAATTTPSAISNAYRIPSGTRVSFGSPSWGALNTWQVRFRWLPNAVPVFYLHYTDANNWLAAQINQGMLSLVEKAAGTTTTLGSASLSSGSYLQFATAYWLQVTQFPTVPGTPALVQAALLSDSSGSVGSALLSIAPVATADAVTALSGQPQIATSGAPLALGGNYANVHTVALFGPGGWTFTPKQGSATAPSSGAWEQDTTKTTSSGPVTSFGAARVDLPASGVADCAWVSYSGGVPVGGSTLFPAPLRTGGDTLAWSVQVRTSGISGTCAQSVIGVEYNSSGVQVASTTLATHTGPQSAWGTPLSGSSWVTNASTVYIGLQLRVNDPTSAGGVVWFDNVQLWNQTQTGQGAGAMPYCELRFPQSPAQLLVSGIQGDAPTPIAASLGIFLGSWGPGDKVTALLGRRARVSSRAQLVGVDQQNNALGGTLALDSTCYGGYYVPILGGTDDTALSPLTSDLVGTYHLYTRFYPVSTSFPVQVGAYAQLVPWYPPSSQVVTWSYLGASSTPFTRANAWNAVDAGPVTLPLTPGGALTDFSQQYTAIGAIITDHNPDANRQNWEMLLPVDGGLVALLANNPSNSGLTITNNWLWTYTDGLGAQLGGGVGAAYNATATGVPSPVTGLGGPGTTTSGYVNINTSADPYMTLDPTQTINGTSVNQFGAMIADLNTDVVPFACEMQYSPLYLYPC